MTLYNANGQINLTSVAGTSYTGLYAADGSWNIVINTATSWQGLQHPCGALNAFVVTDPSAGFYAANGSMNVLSNGSGGYNPPNPPGPLSNLVVLPEQTNFSLGSYSAFAFTFNDPGQHLASWTLNKASFPNASVLNWSTPQGTIPNGGGVWGYHHLDYGNYDASIQQTPIQPQLLCDLTSFSTNFNWSYTGDSEFNLLHEMWLTNRGSTTGSNNSGTTNIELLEVGLLLRAGTTGASFHNSGTLIGTTHVNNGVTYTVRSHGGYITIWSGADVLVGTFDWKLLYSFLLSNEVISGTEWVNGLAFGIEPSFEAGTGTRTGQLVVNSYSATMTGNSGIVASQYTADYLGTNLLVGGGTNLTNWSVQNLTGTTGQPDLNGGTGAIQELETVTNAEHSIFQVGGNAPPIDTGTHTYGMIFDVKPVGRDFMRIEFASSTFAQQLFGHFQFSTKTATFTTGGGGAITGIMGQVIDLGGGWYRCFVTFNKPSDATYTSAFIDVTSMLDATDNSTFVGDVTKGFTARMRARLVQIT